MKTTFKRRFLRLTLSCAVLGAGSFVIGCAEGGSVGVATSGGGGRAGAGNGGEGVGGSGGAGGDSGAGGSGGVSGGGNGGNGGTGGIGGIGGGGGGGMGGAGGGGVITKLSVCVLNAGGPADPCASLETLAYDVVPAGTQRMRSFRIDNDSSADAIFDSVSIQDPDFTVETIRYVEDPPNDPSQWLRVPVTLPSTRPPGGSLHFEVTYTSKGNAEMLAPAEAIVTATVNGMQVPNIVVPIVGEAQGCAAGTGACDANPNNGCETNTNTSNADCGGCGNVCSLPNATPMCANGGCQVAACNVGFDNCNGMSADGCEIDTTTNMNNCGACNQVCDLPNASEVCGASLCLITACTAPYQNCDAQNPNGCETNVQTDVQNCGACNTPCMLANATEACVNGSCAIGACDGAFRDCDMNTTTGCEIDSGSDVNNCGMCGTVCNFANAATSCNAGTCAMGICSAGFTNCDNMAANGCEINTAADPLNCGGCNKNCSTTMVNANVSCSAGACQLGTCLSGYFNADGNAQNGCECQYVGPDLPDNTFADTNCDGIDGDANAAIFVAITGSDANPGTKQQPVLTLAAAMARALAASKTQIYVSKGIYDARVTLANGVSVYGGYDAQNNWSRATTNIVTIQSGTVNGGRISAIEGTAITMPTTLDRLTIKTLDTASAGVSSYAMYCNNCSGITLRNSSLIAGAAGVGAAGVNGAVGSIGGNGNNGAAGACDSAGTRTGGTGGTSACGRTGGAGGSGGAAGVNAGADGFTGAGGTAGGFGGLGGDPGSNGSAGINGTVGSTGSNGSGGIGGSTATNFWVGTAGGGGLIGGNGNGGGGGGGGGGQGGNFLIPGGGNGAGGGGAGGCGGTGATGGAAGGGSFGLFVINTSTMQLINNSFASGKGGNGGAGATGGNGGTGGTGGSGATVCNSEVGAGGKGGNGGAGGRGGHSGGGAGGVSYAVYRVSSPISTSGNILTFGMGGTGGTSPGNAGTNGASGQLF